MNYFIPMEARYNDQELNNFIKNKKYIVLHAPRQSGKTTTILDLVNKLNATNEYVALFVSV